MFRFYNKKSSQLIRGTSGAVSSGVTMLMHCHNPTAHLTNNSINHTGVGCSSSSSVAVTLRTSLRHQGTSSTGSSTADDAASSIETSIHLRENLKVAVYWDIPPTLLKQGEKPMKPFISDQPIAVGHISARFSDNVYAVTLDEVSLSSVIEVGSRVFLRADVLTMNTMVPPQGGMMLVTDPSLTAPTGPGQAQHQHLLVTATPIAAPPTTPTTKVSAASPTLASTNVAVTPASAAAASTDPNINNNINNTQQQQQQQQQQQSPPPLPPRPKLELVAGLVARVNANGTFSILLDNDRFENAVPRSFIVISEGRSRYIHNESYAKVLHWVRNAGVDRRSDQESTATILYHRGWREDKLYLLESEDVHCLSHLNKAVRMCLLERAEWERDHHRQRRELSKERLKEREWRYVMTKYSGVMSACVAVLGVMSVFTWNFKNWQKQQRSFQLKQASETLRKRCKKPTNYRVKRVAEEELRRAFRALDVSHPRLMVCIGPLGAGKSSLIRAAAASEELSAVMVDIRGTDDPLRSLVKALGVANVDACGDLMDFVAEACQIARDSSGHAPLVVFKMRDERAGGLSKVYYEGVALACDRACCHIIVEINEESMKISDAALPRCNFFRVPPFDLSEIHRYTDRSVDPYDLAVFADFCGTNTTDLDDLVANVVVSRKIEAHNYTRRKMEKAMRHLQLLWAKDAVVKSVLTSIGERDYEEGLKMRRAEIHPQCASLLNEIKYAIGGSGGASSSSSSNSIINELKELIYYNPLKDAWMFKRKVYHSAASCWSPPLTAASASSSPNGNGMAMAALGHR